MIRTAIPSRPTSTASTVRWRPQTPTSLPIPKCSPAGDSISKQDFTTTAPGTIIRTLTDSSCRPTRLDMVTGCNMYAYCANNPVGYVDPTGMSVSYTVEKVENYPSTISGIICTFSGTDDKGIVYIATTEFAYCLLYYLCTNVHRCH